MPSFGKQIRRARMDAGLTQQKAADAVGVTLRVYQSYEQGKHSPSLESLVILADLFDVTTDQLLGRIPGGAAD